MRRIILLMSIFIFSSYTVHAYYIEVRFRIDPLVYYDYFTGQIIEKPSNLFNYAHITTDINRDLIIKDNGGNTTVEFTNLYFYDGFNTPALNNARLLGIDFLLNENYDRMYTNSKSIVVDSEYSFQLGYNFLSHGVLYNANGLIYEFSTHINNMVDLAPWNGNGTSDYALYGSEFVGYIQELMLYDIPLEIHEYYFSYSPELGYFNGVKYNGYAYISNFIYYNDENDLMIPEPSTLILIGFSIIALIGIGRLRANDLTLNYKIDRSVL